MWVISDYCPWWASPEQSPENWWRGISLYRNLWQVEEVSALWGFVCVCVWNWSCGPWERRHLLRRTPGGYLGSNWKNRAQQEFLYKGLSCKLHFRERPTLNSVCRLNQPYKGVPGIPFPPIGLKLPSFNWSCPAIFPSPSSPTNPFWPVRTVSFGPVKLPEFGVLICMWMNQSGMRGGDFFCIS